jgi:hypothetical protein
MSVPPVSNNLDLRVPNKEIRSGHIRLGGTNPEGQCIQVTNAFITLNGKPFVGISGEFQFSRFPHLYWEDELLKMKAAGINIIATYVFWIHHEDQKGIFNWSGDKDLRHFVQLCAKLGLWVTARIGPFAHGECRNGGFPDWLYGQPFEVRSNDPLYLACVARFYQEIGRQLDGLLFKDGGPVINLQLDNEYAASGAPWDTADRSQDLEWLPSGSGGEEHMLKLRELARAAGIITPLLSLTAWGSPIIDSESLPVHGGYAYPVWIDTPAPSDMYLFRDLGQDPPSPPQDIHYRVPDFYPPMMAEMQGGIQTRINNRPVVPPASTEAYALVTLGSGCNYIGYYIYHGGSNPLVSGGRANEKLHPQVSYDFQAPIGEYGEVRDASRYLKTLHLFLQSFGEKLAPMGVVLPQGSDRIQETDTHALRCSARVRDDSGFVFLNNFQDHVQTQPIENIRLELALPDQAITIPSQGSLTLQPDVCCLFPFNLDLSGALLAYATAQPLTILHTPAEDQYFFFAPRGIAPEYCFASPSLRNLQGDIQAQVAAEGCTLLQVEPGVERSFAFFSPTGRVVRVITLTRPEAEHTWHGTAWGDDRVLVSNADCVFTHGGVEINSVGETRIDITIFPPVAADLTAAGLIPSMTHSALASHLHLDIPAQSLAFETRHISADKVQIHLPAYLLDSCSDAFLHIVFEADTAAAFIDGLLVADKYYDGTPWVIGLKRFVPAILKKGLTLKFRPLRQGKYHNASTTMAGISAFEGEEKLQIHSIRLIPEYRILLLTGVTS